MKRLFIVFVASIALVACSSAEIRSKQLDTNLQKIQHIVVIYAENRSFDHLYGEFPNANGIQSASAESKLQLDTNGQVLPHLPPVWLSKAQQSDPDQADVNYPNNLQNAPFKINELGAGHQLSDKTRDLVHRFFQNQEQINGGKNNLFAAISDAGGLTIGYYQGSNLPMWKFAQQYTLADNFFMGAFGGSFLNHFYLVCACAPEFKNAPETLRIKLDKQGHLLRTEKSPKSALLGPPQYAADNAVTPDGYAVNTVQPSYQPSSIPPANLHASAFADTKQNPLPPQTLRTIGDALNEKNISWKWYAGGWDAANQDGIQAPEEPRHVIYSKREGSLKFQPHHQPFNYFKNFAPNTDERSTHLRDGAEFIKDIENGELPAVSFYKPAGSNNEHPGYADLLSSDQHITDFVTKIQSSRLWQSTLIIVTYDENGGFWDHVAPPKGDRWGPGTRIPTMVISPYAKKHFIDHTVYDTGAIIKLITRRFSLTPINGVRPFVGDLTNALEF